jgi:hypothetical protein
MPLLPVKKVPSKVLKLIDEALEAIIDQWYLSVSDYYLTAEKKTENPSLTGPEELKRFHDEGGHRIKFAKGDLDFTYGLAADAGPDGCALEVSVNNKVPNFNYGELTRRLALYYDGARRRPVEGFKRLKETPYSAVFHLGNPLAESITVEQREGKADIVRVNFTVLDEHLEELVSDPSAFMEVIHQYCVAPLRRVYAEVYRTKRTRR